MSQNPPGMPYVLDPEWIECPVSKRAPSEAETERPAKAVDEHRALVEACLGIDTALVLLRSKASYDTEVVRVLAEARRHAEGFVPRVHSLKTDPGPFQEVWEGRKPFEVRPSDRDFRVGDSVVLWEHRRAETAFVEAGYTGRWIRGTITAMVHPGQYGLSTTMCVFGLAVEDKGQP